MIKTRLKKINKKIKKNEKQLKKALKEKENQKERETIEEGFKGKRETDQQIQEKEIYRRRLSV